MPVPERQIHSLSHIFLKIKSRFAKFSGFYRTISISKGERGRQLQQSEETEAQIQEHS